MVEQLLLLFIQFIGLCVFSYISGTIKHGLIYFRSIDKIVAARKENTQEFLWKMGRSVNNIELED